MYFWAEELHDEARYVVFAQESRLGQVRACLAEECSDKAENAGLTENQARITRFRKKIQCSLN